VNWLTAKHLKRKLFMKQLYLLPAHSITSLLKYWLFKCFIRSVKRCSFYYLVFGIIWHREVIKGLNYLCTCFETKL